MKYFKNKKVLIISLTILAVLSVTIIAAKSNANKYKSKDMNMSANLLLGMSEKPLVAEEKNDNACGTADSGCGFAGRLRHCQKQAERRTETRDRAVFGNRGKFILRYKL